MKACVIQMPYAWDKNQAEELFEYKMRQLDACDCTMDLIVLPEYSDVPCVTENLEHTLALHNRFIGPLLKKCEATARRCNATVCVNALSPEVTGWRNTTFVFSPSGELAGKYYKLHPAPSETEILGLDDSYTYQPAEPQILEIDGVRYAFLTCYDFYFYEYFSRIAMAEPDVIIGCSLQRTDDHETLETICRFLAYNTNAYVVRAAVSFAEDSRVCGASMIVSPAGSVLVNQKGSFGMGTAEFDPKAKYTKSAGFGNSDAPHWRYMEAGRKPWQYRTGGPMLVPYEDAMPYPRICAHRGFSSVAPENSMPAFGAAIALGAQEIEFDLWPTADGEIVSIHDRTLDRVSDGTGDVRSHTMESLLKLDFGSKFGPKFKDLRIVRFEDILRKFAGHTIMNVHIKPMETPYDPKNMQKIVELVRKYDCERYVYFMIERDDDILAFRKYAPQIPVCVGHDFNRNWAIVDRAIALGAQKVQFFKPYVNQEMIDKAHAHGIKCNIFWADDPEEAGTYLQMGIDTVLTNEYQVVSQVLK